MNISQQDSTFVDEVMIPLVFIHISSKYTWRADIVIHSLHKTLPATQTGLIHVNSSFADAKSKRVPINLSKQQSFIISLILISILIYCRWKKSLDPCKMIRIFFIKTD